MQIVVYERRTTVNVGSEEQPVFQENRQEITLPYTPEHVELAKAEAWNGVYTVEDRPQPPKPLSRLDIIEAQISYTAMMTDTEMGG